MLAFTVHSTMLQDAVSPKWKLRPNLRHFVTLFMCAERKCVRASC